MGWASGSGLAKTVFNAGAAAIDDLDRRRAFYKAVIDGFEDYDCDTLDEAVEFDPDPDPLLVEMLRARWED
jgi:hypothetical protein